MPIIKTWLDIDRIVKEKTNGFTQLPAEMVRIDCSYYVIEIALPDFSDKAKAVARLKDWLGDWFDSTKAVIQLDIGEATIPVEFVESDSHSSPKRRIRPFWENMAYVKNPNGEEAQPKEDVISLPSPFPENFHLIAFHSFKGGVGRTSHLVAYLFALLDRAREMKNDLKILVIDADLEAPGLTYWQHQESLQPTVSFLDFLEAYHYAPTDKPSVIEFYAKELKKSYQDEYGFYFLPACLTDMQLLDIRILPEHLGREINSGWGVSDVLYQLATALDANYVLIDLGAGLCEIASPFLFDPRVERYLLTTLSEQSLRGTTLELEQLSKPMATKLEDVREGRYSDPTVIISMIPQELATSSIYIEADQRLRDAYQVTEEEYVNSARLSIAQTFFAKELLYLSGWTQAYNKLNVGTSVRCWANTLAEDRIPAKKVAMV
jgi:MinD-like ATPase involved in chromosome partitioning or flagellar assembly